MITPSHLQIETINGVCTARCTMCAIASWTRPPHRMNGLEFEEILWKFMNYRPKLQYLSLFGFGEPLLDKGLPGKIRMAKQLKFHGVGIATNCTELTPDLSEKLISAGIDTIICSVDGITKETHEAIRVGTNYEKVVDNIRELLFLRSFHFRLKVIIRFIRQKANVHEWPKFKAYWEGQLDFDSYGDAVISFDVVDCDGKVKDYETKDVLWDVGGPMVCDQINKRLIVLSNGDVALCCGDDNGKFGLGNVLRDDPIDIYNGPVFTHYREMMAAGRIAELDLCKSCTIPRSLERKDKVV